MRRELPDVVDADRGGRRELVRAVIGGVRLPADVARALPVLARELPEPCATFDWRFETSLDSRSPTAS